MYVDSICNRLSRPLSSAGTIHPVVRNLHASQNEAEWAEFLLKELFLDSVFLSTLYCILYVDLSTVCHIFGVHSVFD